MSPCLSRKDSELRAEESVPMVGDTDLGSYRAWICAVLKLPNLKHQTTLPLKEVGHRGHLFLLVSMAHKKHNGGTKFRRHKIQEEGNCALYPCTGLTCDWHHLVSQAPQRLCHVSLGCEVRQHLQEDLRAICLLVCKPPQSRVFL
jgi:hypothetical protein